MLEVFGLSVLRHCSHRRRDFSLETPTGAVDSNVLRTRQWATNPARELGAGVHLPLPTLLEAMNSGVLVIMSDDQCSIDSVVFVSFIEVS